MNGPFAKTMTHYVYTKLITYNKNLGCYRMPGFMILRDEINVLSDLDPEEIEVQKLAKTVSEVVGVSDKVQLKAGKVRKAMIHFLRCAALMFHYITDVPLPTLDTRFI